MEPLFKTLALIIMEQAAKDKQTHTHRSSNSLTGSRHTTLSVHVFHQLTGDANTPAIIMLCSGFLWLFSMEITYQHNMGLAVGQRVAGSAVAAC